MPLAQFSHLGVVVRVTREGAHKMLNLRLGVRKNREVSSGTTVRPLQPCFLLSSRFPAIQACGPVFVVAVLGSQGCFCLSLKCYPVVSCHKRSGSEWLRQQDLVLRPEAGSRGQGAGGRSL